MFLSKQFAKFLVAGGLAALLNFGSRFVYNVFTTFSTAVILAYFTGIFSGFILTKLFVFEKSSNSTRKEFVYYFMINLFGLLLTYSVTIGLAEYIFPSIGMAFFPKAIAHAAGIAVPVFTSFLGHKYLTFKR